MRKVFATISIMLLFSLNAAAQGGKVTVSVGSSGCAPGGKAAVEIGVAQSGTSFFGMEFTLLYDASSFELTEDDIKPGDEFAGEKFIKRVDSQKGTILISSVRLGGYDFSSAKLCTIEFTAKSMAKAGKYIIEASKDAKKFAIDSGGKTLELEVKPGEITVTEAEGTGDGSIGGKEEQGGEKVNEEDKVLSGEKESVSNGEEEPTSKEGDNKKDEEGPLFDDMQGYEWAWPSVDTLYRLGIIKGVGERSFAPSAKIKRGDFLLLAIRMLGLKSDAADNFDDVPQGSYYYEAIATAKSLGLVGGTGNNKFEPEANIKRQDMFVMTYRILKSLKPDPDGTDGSVLSGFSDEAQISDYAREALSYFVQNGIVKGDGEALHPLSEVTRAETAVFVHRLYISLSGIK